MLVIRFADAPMENIWDSAKNFRYTEMETNGGARKLDLLENMGALIPKKNAMMLSYRWIRR